MLSSATSRPTGLWIFSGVALLSCGDTNLDVLKPVEPVVAPSVSALPTATTTFVTAPLPNLSFPLPAASSAQPAPESMDGGAPPCPAQGALVANTYRIASRVNGGCIQAQNDVVRVGALNLGYALLVTAPCPQDQTAEFHLTGMFNGNTQIKYPGAGDPPAGLVFDIKMGQSTPGTPLILYDANGLGNQQFRFADPIAGFSAILPVIGTDLCVAVEVDGHLSTQTCLPNSPEQEWQILPPGCMFSDETP